MEKKNFIEKIISSLEKERFGIFGAFLFVSAIIIARTLIEDWLSWKAVGKSVGLAFYMSAMAFYVPQFLGVILVLKIFTKEKLLKLINLSCWGFLIILFPPIYDFLLMGRTQTYIYIPKDTIPQMITSFYLRIPSPIKAMGDGQVIQFILLFILGTFYVAIKTKSVWKTSVFFILLYFCGPFLATPEINPFFTWKTMPREDILSLYYLMNFIIVSIIIILLIGFVSNKKLLKRLIKSSSLTTTFHFVLIVLIGVIVVAGEYITDGEEIRVKGNVVIESGNVHEEGGKSYSSQEPNPYTSKDYTWNYKEGIITVENGHVNVPAIITKRKIDIKSLEMNIIDGWVIGENDVKIFDEKAIKVKNVTIDVKNSTIAGEKLVEVLFAFPLSRYGEPAIIGIAIFSAIFLWQYAVWINHVYDVDIDKITNRERILPMRMISPGTIKKMAIIFAFISLGLAFVIGWAIIPAIIALILATIYSVPPFRLRKTILSSVFIGAGSSLAFLFGYLNPYLYMEGMKNVDWMFNPYHAPITNEAILIAILIFIALSIGSVTRSLKDYEGDKKAGVRNIFTVYGKEKGVKIASFLIIISFISPIMLFYRIVDIVIFVAGGLIASYLFNKTKRIETVFGLYFPVLIYCILRWIEVF